MSSATQKKAIKEFRAVTGVTEKIATETLTSQKWELERALDYFFQNRNKFPSTDKGKSKSDASKLIKVFDKYAGNDEKTKDIIFDEKLGEFFTDIGINPEGSTTLGLAWMLKAKTFGEFERKEFLEGFGNVGADSIDKIKIEAKKVEEQLKDKRQFKEFYRWLFDFVKEEPERKTLDPETCYEMWNIVLPQHFPLLPEWIAFCQKQKLKPVPKDLWEQVFEFARDVKPDLSNYDADGAWPVMIDEFVDYIRDKNKK